MLSRPLWFVRDVIFDRARAIDPRGRLLLLAQGSEQRVQLLVCRLHHIFEGRLLGQGRRGQDHPGRADPALRAALGDKSRLERMSALQALDRLDLRAARLREGNQAGIDRLAVEQNRAGATLSLAAAFLRARQSAFLAQDV